MTNEILIFLFFLAVVAGTIDTLAGGGGLITIPALMLSGMPPLVALGTNKVQAVAGSATASFMMFKKKKVKFKDVRVLVLYAFLGSIVGSIMVQFIDVDVLSFVIPLALVGIVVYFIMAPVPKQSEAKITKSQYKKSAVPLIGLYDGAFGPGTGSFFALAGVSLRGHDLIHSTAVAKTLNFGTNIASVIVFVAAGKVLWIPALTMMLGQFIGAQLGSHFLFKINPNHLRLLLISICLIMLTKYAMT